ncbi:hypothetical protein ALP8811_02246 [Aliiroseovarius pelagivivens]|uniref:Uncharacterized protein n=1 Tax=Aliiroseovarius pelagivivens TaxID=1639690 RepID=A0A2R8AME3_9RHOB|nr:hypothetical protein ALP8811_02246 [Aliiroseovarius pelagivivens]
MLKGILALAQEDFGDPEKHGVAKGADSETSLSH